MPVSVVVPRLSDSTAAQQPAAEARTVDPPSVVAIRLAFGVGSGDTPPTPSSFKTTYHVSIPVFSLGGLDPDGVHEFDAAALFETISRRAQRRRWGVRLELEFQQAPQSVSLADMHVDAPYDDESLGLHVLGHSGRGTPLAGGGRSVTIATGIITDIAGVRVLNGPYTVSVQDQPRGGDAAAGIHSQARSVRVDVTRFEFEA